MGERQPRVTPFELLLADRLPQLVDRLHRIVRDLRLAEFEMSDQRRSGFPREPRIVGDDVHLGVVEQRVLVQVRRAQREPVVVDDRDLRVDVDGIGDVARAGEEEQASTRPASSSASIKWPSTPRVSSAPLFGFDGSSSTSRKSGCGGWTIFAWQHGLDLGRPEELVLDVDEALGGLERPHVRLENGEIAPRFAS